MDPLLTLLVGDFFKFDNMKLTFQTNHISITHFEPIEIESFTVLTGINGSGKTHLLQGIKNGYIEIDGIHQTEIIYYNYNDFTVYTDDVSKNNIYTNRIMEWKLATQASIQKINQFKDSVYVKIIEGKSVLDQIICSLIRHKDFDFETQYGRAEDYKLIEDLKQKLDKKESLELLLRSYQDQLKPEFFTFLFTYLLNNKGDINYIKKDLLKSRFESLSTEIQEFYNKENPEFYFFLKNKVDKKMFSLTPEDFESPHLLLQDIANEEKQYQILKDQNILKKVKATEYGEQLDFLEKDDFIIKYGLSPIEEINKVLSTYDCNGYRLIEINKKDFLGIDQNSINLIIKLQQKEEEYTTTFDQLSSGEKTLIALSLLICKSKKKKIIPRVLLLDEIDSSLHPSMITRLLDVIENLFIKQQGLKIILATHSPTTIALSPEKSIFVVNKNGGVKISKQDKSTAIGLLTEGFATLNLEDTNMSIAYNISQTRLPILFTEGITDKIIIETAWKKINGKKAMPFYIQDCFDASFLANLFKRGYDKQDGIFITYSDRILIALFDFDYEGYNAWNSLSKLSSIIETDPHKGLTKKNNEGNAYALLIPVSSNPEVKKQVIKTGTETFKHESLHAIELLFYGIEELKDHFTKEPIKGGGEIISFKGKKRDFANALNNLSTENFNEFKTLFSKLEKLITSTSPLVHPAHK
ncbi:MAG: protein putative AbiEii toxin, Type system [Chitinophagaceae bacterium]|nr:protein putative AbiEii toxin, Type system [Chitinophagaceae bacterium]